MTGSHAHEVAQLEEEAIVGTGEVPELKRVSLGERRAVPDEQDRAGDRFVREQHVVPEIVRHRSGGGTAVHEQRLSAARVAQRYLILREVLPDVADEDGARELVLELEPWDIGRREATPVLRPCESLMHPSSLDPHGR